jgi:hypothetical protein
VIRTLLQPGLAAALLLGAGLVQTSSPPPRPAPVHVAPVQDPLWSARWSAATARSFPGCGPTRVLGDVVVVGADGRARRMGFDRAWRLTHDASPETGGWVVGWCRSQI